jgi:hypothetical protein
MVPGAMIVIAPTHGVPAVTFTAVGTILNWAGVAPFTGSSVSQLPQEFVVAVAAKFTGVVPEAVRLAICAAGAGPPCTCVKLIAAGSALSVAPLVTVSVTGMVWVLAPVADTVMVAE